MRIRIIDGGEDFYNESVCQFSEKGDNSPYKCRCTECKHHAKHVPDGGVEFWEFNPFSKSSKIKCPYYQTKAQMTVRNNRRSHEVQRVFEK